MYVYFIDQLIDQIDFSEKNEDILASLGEEEYQPITKYTSINNGKSLEEVNESNTKVARFTAKIASAFALFTEDSDDFYEYVQNVNQ